MVLLTLMAVLLYLLGFYTMGHDPSTYVVNSLTLGMGFAVVITWFTAAMAALANGIRTPANKIVIAIFSIWLILEVQRVIAILTVVFQGPDWIVNGPYTGVITTLLAIQAMYIIVAPAQGNAPTRLNLVWIVVGSGLGGAVAGGLLVLFGKLVLA